MGRRSGLAWRGWKWFRINERLLQIVVDEAEELPARITDANLAASMVRRTVVLEDDVLERLQAESQLREDSFRGTLNDVIRDGLAVAKQRRQGSISFRVNPREMGLKPGLSYDSVSALIELGEGDDARWGTCG